MGSATSAAEAQRRPKTEVWGTEVWSRRAWRPAGNDAQLAGFISAAIVSLSTRPVAFNPFAFWKSITAAWVFGPILPSTGRVAPLALSAVCNFLTRSMRADASGFAFMPAMPGIGAASAPAEAAGAGIA